MPIPENLINANNDVLRRGADALGWRWRVPLHNRAECSTCGHCMLGCAYNRKYNAALSWLPRAVAAGARILSHTPYSRARRGLTIYLRTPRLRGLLALSLCAAAGGAMVFVNTVVIVRDALRGDQQQVAWALAAFGAGSMLLALWLPRLLDRVSDRQVMLSRRRVADAIEARPSKADAPAGAAGEVLAAGVERDNCGRGWGDQPTASSADLISGRPAMDVVTPVISAR